MFRAQATLALEFEREGDWGDLLPREYGVLYALAGAPNGLRMTELCDDVLLTQAGISRLVSRLEKRGLVQRSGDPADARAYRIRLTPEGVEVQRALGRTHGRQVAEAMTRALDDEQLRTLRELSLALSPPRAAEKEPTMNDIHPGPPPGRGQRRGQRPILDPAARRPDRPEDRGHPPRHRHTRDREHHRPRPDRGRHRRSLVSGFPNEAVQEAIDRLAKADAIIAATPVYKAGISGLFKSFADLLDNDLLIAKPVILAATGGSARHAMVVDDQLRPLFAFLRAIPTPTSLYAAPEDWASSDLGHRLARAATELALLVRSGAPARSPTTTGPATRTSSPATRPGRSARSATSTSTAT